MPSPPSVSAQREAFHVMTKAIGPICNLNCQYCFYLEKKKLFPANENFKMSDEVLESYIRQYIEDQSAPDISFAWQGGEPTLLGVDFFRKALVIQQKYRNGKTISNAIQTNGTLLNDEWGRFLAENRFLVGLSIDGPARLHNIYRRDKQQGPTFDEVMRGCSVLKKYRVDFNTLTVVNRENSKKPLEVYHFLKEIGSGFIQFIPLVERKPERRTGGIDLDLAMPPGPEEPDADLAVTPWSVSAPRYGEFLCTIFDEWVHHDVGRVFVQLFDVALGNWLGLGSSLCTFAEKCGTAVALEHNGDLYSCDHYVYPQYRLGNILNQGLGEMINSPAQREFGNAKLDSLPDYCRRCDVRFACNGECPKHRFMRTPQGEPGLNYLCAAYKRFFHHIDPFMQMMGSLLKARRAPSEIMAILAQPRR